MNHVTGHKAQGRSFGYVTKWDLRTKPRSTKRGGATGKSVSAFENGARGHFWAICGVGWGGGGSRGSHQLAMMGKSLNADITAVSLMNFIIVIKYSWLLYE